MRCAAWLRLRFAGGAVQADDLPFAVRPFEDARRDAGAFDRLAIREDDRVVIGFGSDRDLAFAAHRDLIVLEGKGLERLQLGREMMIAIMREIPFDAARLEDLGRSEERRVGEACVSTCRSRVAAVHSNKKLTTQDMKPAK